MNKTMPEITYKFKRDYFLLCMKGKKGPEGLKNNQE